MKQLNLNEEWMSQYKSTFNQSMRKLINNLFMQSIKQSRAQSAYLPFGQMFKKMSAFPVSSLQNVVFCCWCLNQFFFQTSNVIFRRPGAAPFTSATRMPYPSSSGRFSVYDWISTTLKSSRSRTMPPQSSQKWKPLVAYPKTSCRRPCRSTQYRRHYRRLLHRRRQSHGMLSCNINIILKKSLHRSSPCQCRKTFIPRSSRPWHFIRRPVSVKCEPVHCSGICAFLVRLIAFQCFPKISFQRFLIFYTNQKHFIFHNNDFS